MPLVHITLNSLIPKPYDFEPKTFGEHILKRRIFSGMFQKEVAKLIGVSSDTICGWENDQHHPGVRYMPLLIKFLGYDPNNIDLQTTAEHLKSQRLKS